MNEKNFSGKLAAGMRRAKQPGATEAAVPGAPTTSSVTPPAPPAAPRRNDEPSPTRSAGPWADLHPMRVWPD